MNLNKPTYNSRNGTYSTDNSENSLQDQNDNVKIAAKGREYMQNSKTGGSDAAADALDDFAKGKVKSEKGLTSSFCSSKNCEDEQKEFDAGNDTSAPEGMEFLEKDSIIGQVQEGGAPDTRFNQNQHTKSQDDNGSLDDNAAMDLLVANDPDQMIVEDVVQVREAMEKPDESSNEQKVSNSLYF